MPIRATEVRVAPREVGPVLDQKHRFQKPCQFGTGELAVEI